MKIDQLNTMMVLISTNLPYPHTKAERIEELKSILANGDNISNTLIAMVGKEVYKLSKIPECLYQEYVTANNKLDELVKRDKDETLVLSNSLNNSNLLSMNRKVDLLMTNISIISQIFRPLAKDDAERLVVIMEKENISPLTMTGAIHGYWLVILDKEHPINLSKNKAVVMHEFATLLRVITESMVYGITIDSRAAVKNAFIEASKNLTLDQRAIEYVLNTPSQLEFYRRMTVKAAAAIHAHYVTRKVK